MQGSVPCTAVAFLYAQKGDGKMRRRGGFRFPPLLTFSLEATQEGASAPLLDYPIRERETGDQKRMFPRHRALM